MVSGSPGLGGDIPGNAERLLTAARTATVATGVFRIRRHPADGMAAGHARPRKAYGRRLLPGLASVAPPHSGRAASTGR
ncbi:hypothetical protein AQJ11_09070 [Streptomyces corchorusii]|uniref:Uncharacterized protein n=2 Tax=Streptomyces TaxID=1883 RepID=A0A101QJA4_STRCK|nr:hypothetical protein [Streptomyces corchorusii]KUN30859.1 hypothetical protein AQJ11_09070 [Streptomyces corchorusii]